ncbi:MAG TPA: 4Fe-4S dicluster domain-containing protein [Armatimonadetes bacterium]|nr:4Fe-4S dicluster domain-containing protein [Armatimonadota bacterium]
MIRSKLKEVAIALKGWKSTLPYPFGPGHPVPVGFRGKVEVDLDKCIGCAGCANVCPTRCIEVVDIDQETRRIEIHRERCIFCARCNEVCPEGAIYLTFEFELSTDNKEDLLDRLEVYMATCQRCGRCFEPANPLDRMMVTGFRWPEERQREGVRSDGAGD